MARVVVKPLDGAEGYLRWKESMFLRIHTVGVAHVLSEDPPAGDEGAAAAAKTWARDDALCRGHILAALSNRLFPDYTSATPQAGRCGGAHDMSEVARRRFNDFEFDDGAPLLEQIAHAEALAAGIKPPYEDDFLAGELCDKLPEYVAMPLIARPGNISMSIVCRAARIMEAIRTRREDEHQGDAAMAEDHGRSGSAGPAASILKRSRSQLRVAFWRSRLLSKPKPTQIEP